MAYTSDQRRQAAYELARSAPTPDAPPNLATACRALQSEYETMRGITENTLRRFMKEPSFVALVKNAGKTLETARAASDMERERKRTAKDSKLISTILDELDQDEALLQKLRESCENAITGLDPAEKLRFTASFSNLLDTRRAKLLPAVSTTDDGKRLITCMVEVLFKHCSAAQAQLLVSKISKAYAARAT